MYPKSTKQDILMIFLRNRNQLTNFVVSGITFVSVLETVMLTQERPGFRTTCKDRKPSIKVRSFKSFFSLHLLLFMLAHLKDNLQFCENTLKKLKNYY